MNTVVPLGGVLVGVDLVHLVAARRYCRRHGHELALHLVWQTEEAWESLQQAHVARLKVHRRHTPDLTRTQCVLCAIPLGSSNLANCVFDGWVSTSGKHAIRFVKDPVDFLLVQVAQRSNNFVVGEEQSSERIDELGQRWTSQWIRETLAQQFEVHRLAPIADELLHFFASRPGWRRISKLTLKTRVNNCGISKELTLRAIATVDEAYTYVSNPSPRVKDQVSVITIGLYLIAPHLTLFLHSLIALL